MPLGRTIKFGGWDGDDYKMGYGVDLRCMVCGAPTAAHIGRTTYATNRKLVLCHRCWQIEAAKRRSDFVPKLRPEWVKIVA